MIKSELTDVVYSTWGKYLEKAYMEENNIIIKAPDRFVQGIVQCRYLPLYHSAYSYFRNDFRYDDILVEVDENNTLDEENKHDIGENEVIDSSVGYNIKTCTAKEMGGLADQRNIKLLDIKKETEKTLRKVLDTVEMMAQKGEFSIIKNVTEELEELGFRTEVLNFTSTKAISIKWDLEGNNETKIYSEDKKEIDN